MFRRFQYHLHPEDRDGQRGLFLLPIVEFRDNFRLCIVQVALPRKLVRVRTESDCRLIFARRVSMTAMMFLEVFLLSKSGDRSLFVSFVARAKGWACRFGFPPEGSLVAVAFLDNTVGGIVGYL